MEIEVVMPGFTDSSVNNLIDWIQRHKLAEHEPAAARLLSRVYSAHYRREREHYFEWVDVGGEA